MYIRVFRKTEVCNIHEAELLFSSISEKYCTTLCFFSSDLPIPCLTTCEIHVNCTKMHKSPDFIFLQKFHPKQVNKTLKCKGLFKKKMKSEE